MGKIRAAVSLIHPFPVSIVVVSSLILLIIAHRGLPSLDVLVRAGAVVLLSQVSVGALNDFHDRALDAVTQPQKPLPAGLVPPGVALLLAAASLVLFVPLALTFGWVAFILSMLGTAAGLAYDLWLKATPLSFAGYVAGFLLLLTWVWLVAGHLTLALFLTYPPGALLIVAAHLAQSLPDIESDQATGQRGLAVVLGPRRTLCAIFTFYVAAGIAGGAAALRAGSAAALVLGLASLGLAFASLPSARHAVRHRPARIAVFHLMAPAIALLSLGSVLAASTILGAGGQN